MYNIGQYKRAFTLIELIIVIVLLGILAATALPKFTDLSGRATTSSNAAHIGAFRTAVGIAHGIWVADGNSGAADITFNEAAASADLHMTATGWPDGAAGASALNCTEVWDIMMQQSMSSAGYSQAAAGAVCTYTKGTGSFTYNSSTGVVS